MPKKLNNVQKRYSLTTGFSNAITNNWEWQRERQQEGERNRAHIQPTVRSTVPLSALQTQGRAVPSNVLEGNKTQITQLYLQRQSCLNSDNKTPPSPKTLRIY